MDLTGKGITQILTEAALITEEQAQEALAQRHKKTLTQTLIELGYVTEEQVATVLAEKTSYPYVNLSDYPINRNVATLISEEVAKKYYVVPIEEEGNKIILAMADPANIYAIDDIQIITGRQIEPVVATEGDILDAIHRYCVTDNAFETATERALSTTAEVESIYPGKMEIEDAPIIRLVNLILNQAINERSSDIHIEPGENQVRVRYRIDGVLQEIMKFPMRIHSGLVSRVKIMADMNIADHRVPQDGRCGIILGDRAVDMRIASMPTVHGEKLVMRILEKDTAVIGLEEMGFEKETFARYRESFTKPYGAILVTGPTGSGKSTTLYATLSVLNQVGKNIITIEDPVEYRLDGVSQMQVNNQAGLTFANGLRSILRSDPDIIMVGEIRDRETALIAVESALTGHLVLSTLHTNDAAGALTRLIEMGIEPFLVGSAVDCVIAQRLIRKLCRNCKEIFKPSESVLSEIGLEPEADDIFAKPRGCPKCNESGYYGRLGVYEVLLVSEEIERLTVSRASTDEIAKTAIKEGMTTMKQEGFKKARKGITSIEEILRVIS